MKRQESKALFRLAWRKAVTAAPSTRPRGASRREGAGRIAHPPATRHTPSASDTSPRTGAGDGASALSPWLALLLAGQHQQLGVGGEHLPHRLLEFAPSFHATTDILDPILGDVLDMLPATHHEGQGPDGMAGAVGTVAVGLAAAEMGKGERAGKQILGKMEPPHEFRLALPESGRLRTSVFDLHLMVSTP